VSLRDLAPYASLIGAIGVALLLTARIDRLRIAGAGLFAAGALPLGLYHLPSLTDRLTGSPAVALAVLLASAAGLAGGTWLALKLPWVVPLVALAAGLRLPFSETPSALHHLLPLYAAVGAGVAAMAVLSRRGEWRGPRLAWVGPALAIYIVLACASLAWTPDFQLGAFAVVAFYLPLGALVAYMGGLELRGDLLRILTAALFGLAGVFAAVGVYQVVTETIWRNPKVMVANAYAPFFRTNSLFWDPSLYGRFLMLAILVACCIVVLRPSARACALGVAAIVLWQVGLILSYSQSSMLALCAGLALLAAITWRRAALLTLAVAAVVILASLALPGTRDLLRADADSLTSGRSTLIERGWEVFSEHPFAGAGIGGYRIAAAETLDERRRLAPHNLPIAVGSELGLLGLIALALLAATLVLALVHPRVSGTRTFERIVLAVLLAGLVTHSLFYNAFFEDPVVWAVLALIGLCGSEQQRERHARPHVQQVRRLEHPPEPEQEQARGGIARGGGPGGA